MGPPKKWMCDWGYVTSFLVEWSYFTLLIASFSGPHRKLQFTIDPPKDIQMILDELDC